MANPQIAAWPGVSLTSMSESNWLAPQHPLDAADIEPASSDDELAEYVEAAIWHTFRNASTAQVAALTRQIRQAAIRYAESWTHNHPRRQIP